MPLFRRENFKIVCENCKFLNEEKNRNEVKFDVYFGKPYFCSIKQKVIKNPRKYSCKHFDI